MTSASQVLYTSTVMVLTRGRTRRHADIAVYRDRIEWRKRVNLLIAGHDFETIPMFSIRSLVVNQKLARDAHLVLEHAGGSVTFWFRSVKIARQVHDLIETQRRTASQQPARWLPDPGHRHELRYFDGVRWTENVSNAGITAIDHLPQQGQWVTDPWHRHELRYFDGVRWTENVSNAGITAIDHLPQ